MKSDGRDMTSRQRERHREAKKLGGDKGKIQKETQCVEKAKGETERKKKGERNRQKRWGRRHRACKT